MMALVVGSILLSADSVWACSCSSPSLQDAVEFAPNIVTLKLKEVNENANDKNGKKRELSKLIVTKVYKGNLKVGETITHKVGLFCSWSFDKEDVGTEYVFYLDKPDEDGFWNGSICSRSKKLKYAGADLLYLDKINDVRGKSRLSGIVTQQIRPAFEGGDYADKLLIDREVIIIGNGKTITVKTDKNGAYEIYDLPSGIYEVIPQKIEGYKLNFDWEMVDSKKFLLKPNGHTEASLSFSIFNSISGKILDEKGRGMKDVCVYLRPDEGKEARSLFAFSCSKDDGSFRISGIPVEKYVLVINEDGEITANQPFKTFYYPNSAKRETAQIFTIEAGKQIEGLVIKPVPKVETILISGKVVFEDGISPTEIRNEFASISFTPNNPTYNEKNRQDKSYSSSNLTNEKGEFSLRVYKGQKGKLFASMISYVGQYQDCPKLDNLIRAKGDSVQHVETNILEIDAEKDLENVILKFPFPSCKKAKK